MKVIAHLGTLMRKAKALGNARKSKNTDAIKKAEEDHDAYKKICLEADEIII